MTIALITLLLRLKGSNLIFFCWTALDSETIGFKENSLKYSKILFDRGSLGLLSQMLEFSPHKRITVHEALNHPCTALEWESILWNWLFLGRLTPPFLAWYFPPSLLHGHSITDCTSLSCMTPMMKWNAGYFIACLKLSPINSIVFFLLSKDMGPAGPFPLLRLRLDRHRTCVHHTLVLLFYRE